MPIYLDDRRHILRALFGLLALTAFWLTSSAAPVGAATVTPTASPTATGLAPATPTLSDTSTPSPTATFATPTPAATLTASPTSTYTPTPTAVPATTPTAPSTASATPTATLSLATAAAASGLAFSPPIVISAGDEQYGRTPEPASGPTILGLEDRKAQVIWWVRSDMEPSEDWMWQTYVTAGSASPPLWLWGAPGAQQPRLAAGPGGSLHLVYRSWNPGSSAYNTNYIERLPTDPGSWPPPAYGPPPLFPAEMDATDANLAVTRNPVGGETRTHLVWSQATEGLSLPALYYTRVGVGWQKGFSDGSASIRGPDCSSAGVGINCYVGYAPAIAVVDRGAARDVIVVWEGRNYLNGADTVYFGRTHLQPNGTTDQEWSIPAELSGGASGKAAACPSLRAEKPAVAVSPAGQLHAVWLEQAVDCNYYVRTARLRYDPSQDRYLPDYLEQVSPRPVSIENQTAVDRPRLAFDARGRRYVVWKESYTEVRAAAASADQDDWQDLGKVNSGVCGGNQVVEAVDLSASPSRTALHAAWVSGVGSNNAHVCYSNLDTLVNRVHLPLLMRNTPHP